MTDLLSTRVQRNWGTDHVYLTNAKMANIWYCITGKKTVSDIDISNLRFLIKTVIENLELGDDVLVPAKIMSMFSSTNDIGKQKND